MNRMSVFPGRASSLFLTARGARFQRQFHAKLNPDSLGYPG